MTTFKVKVPTYQNLIDFLGDREVKQIAHNTIVRLSPEKNSLYVEYHNYIIGVITEDTIKLSSCGWHTSTTKLRLNWILKDTPYCIYQKKFVWYIHNYDNNRVMEFYDKMTVKP